MMRKRLIQSMDPCALIAEIRRCVPDDGPICETELRTWIREMDAVVREVKRAQQRRYEESEAA